MYVEEPVYIGQLFLFPLIDRFDFITIYISQNISHSFPFLFILLLYREHPNEKVPYHYYDPSSKPECTYYHTSEVRLTSGHLFITEKAVFARWSNIYNIHFHFPYWEPRPYSVSDTLRTPFLLRYHIANNRLFAKYPYWKLYFHFAGIFYPLVH